MISYGKTIEWTDASGWKQSVSANGYSSREEANESVLRMAVQSGWTPPRWWQFWRWGDTK